MVAKPATYQDLKREIRKQFPMLASVFSVLILFKPDVEDGSLLSNWVEVDPSAYSVVRDGAHIFINVAEPITKRYMFPFPDGRNSNVGPLNQVADTSGVGNHTSPFMDGVVHDGQVSITKSRTSKSKYNYTDSETSPKLQRSDGAACASGWAGASEKFRRSAKLIPDLKDCKGAIGLEVGESNCYPDEEEYADKNCGHFQGGDEEEEPNPVLTEKGWYTGAEDSVRGDQEAGNVPLDDYGNFPTTLTAKDDFSYEDNQHDGNNAGRKIPLPNANNMRTSVSYHMRPTGDPGPPSDGSSPEEDISWGARYYRDIRKNLYTIAPRSKSESVRKSGDGAQNGAKGFFLRPCDYVQNHPCGSRSTHNTVLMNEGGRRRNATHNQEDDADQRHAHTAYTYDLNEFAPTVQTALTSHRDDGLANQVSRKTHNHSEDYRGSDWSPPRRQYSFLGWPQQPQPQVQAQAKSPSYRSPPYGSPSPIIGPGWITRGSPVAKFRRSSHLPHWNTAGLGKKPRADAGHHNQAQVQTDSEDDQQQKYDLDHSRGVGGLGDSEVYRSQFEGKYEHEQYQRDDSEDFWYAPCENATKTAGGEGGAFKSNRRAVHDTKKTTNKSGQENRAGRKVNNTGWGELSKSGMW